MSLAMRHQLLIVAAAGIVCFSNLGVPRLWDEDEPKNATCAREMFLRGDWIVPTFNIGKPKADQLAGAGPVAAPAANSPTDPSPYKDSYLRTDKPILLYWFMLVAYQLFGVNEFSARFWSAMAGIGTALLTYRLGRRLVSPQAGFWAALLISTALMFVVASRAATPDALLIFFSTLTLYLFARATFPEVGGESPVDPNRFGQPPTDLVNWIGIYSAMGLAVLAKGPIGVVMPVAIIGTYYLCLNTPYEAKPSHSWRTRLLKPLIWFAQTFDPRRIVVDAWKMRPITLLLVVLGIALPWYLLVGVRTDWLWPEGFLRDHNVGRFSDTMEGHSGPVFYYIAAMAAGFFPGSVFLVPTFLYTRKQLAADQPRRMATIFLLVWVAMFLAVFSFSATKLPSYISPIYPALALLTAGYLRGLVRAPQLESKFWFRAAMVSLAVVGMAMLFGFTYAARQFLPGKEYLGLIGIVPFVAAIVCLYYFEQGEPRYMIRCFAGSAILFATGLFALAPVEVDRYQEATLIEWGRHGGRELATYRAMRPSWVYYARGSLLRYDDVADVEQFLREKKGRGIVTEERHLQQLRAALPENADVVALQSRFLRDGKIVLVRLRDKEMGAAERQPINLAGLPETERRRR